MNPKQGFASAAVIIILVLLAAGAVYVLTKDRAETSTVCTLDAKQCPDGSYVSRVGPSCEFAACPNDDLVSGNVPADWKTYSDKNYGFEFQYPPTSSVHDNLPNPSGGNPIPNKYIGNVGIGDSLTFSSSLILTTRSLKDETDRILSGIKGTPEFKEITIGGVKANQYIDSNMKSYTLWSRGYYTYTFMPGLGKEIEDQILSTFKFIN